MLNSALYVAWKLETSPSDSTGSLRQLLTRGEDRQLYRLCSWMVAKGEARALLVPAAPLEEIANALWTPVAAPSATRWIAGRRNCAEMTRDIETAPVRLGLASRPEQWPHSSAAQE